MEKVGYACSCKTIHCSASVFWVVDMAFYTVANYVMQIGFSKCLLTDPCHKVISIKIRSLNTAQVTLSKV